MWEVIILRNREDKQLRSFSASFIPLADQSDMKVKYFMLPCSCTIRTVGGINNTWPLNRWHTYRHLVTLPVHVTLTLPATFPHPQVKTVHGRLFHRKCFNMCFKNFKTFKISETLCQQIIKLKVS